MGLPPFVDSSPIVTHGAVAHKYFLKIDFEKTRENERKREKNRDCIQRIKKSEKMC
jgi:hypothetical protein